MVLLTLAGFAAAGALNRFFRMRFCVTACLSVSLAQILALTLVAWMATVPLNLTLLPALGVLAVGCCVFIVLAGALAVRLPPAAVTTGVALAALSSFVWPVRAILPDIERFWLVDAFADGGMEPELLLLSRSLRMIYLMCADRARRQKSRFTVEDMIDIAHIYSRQTEHSLENVEIVKQLR